MPKKIVEPTREQLVELYEVQKLSTDVVAKSLGISRCALYARFEKFQIPLRSLSEANINRYDHQLGMTSDQEQLAYGSLLGDASLSVIRKETHTGYCLMFAHGRDQLPYLKHKRKVMGGSKIGPRPEGSNLGKIVYQFAYQNRPALAEMSRVCLVSQRREVTPEWIQKLDWRGIAYWYQDDGTLIWNGNKSAAIRFYTNSFVEQSVDLLVDFLKLKGLSSVTAQPILRGSAQRVINCFRYDDVLEFLSKLEPFVVPCLKYKVKICQSQSL